MGIQLVFRCFFLGKWKFSLERKRNFEIFLRKDLGFPYLLVWLQLLSSSLILSQTNRKTRSYQRVSFICSTEVFGEIILRTGLENRAFSLFIVVYCWLVLKTSPKVPIFYHVVKNWHFLLYILIGEKKIAIGFDTKESRITTFF